jgi:hypothetical protein
MPWPGMRPHPVQHPRNLRTHLEAWLAFVEGTSMTVGGMCEEASGFVLAEQRSVRMRLGMGQAATTSPAMPAVPPL